MSESTSALMSRWDAEDWEYDEETGGLVHLLRADDAVQAGLWKPGETALIVSGSSARMASGLKDCPVDAAIVGIVDHVEVPEMAEAGVARQGR